MRRGGKIKKAKIFPLLIYYWKKQKKSYTIDTVNETEMEQLMKFIHVSDVHLGIKPDEGKPWSEKKSAGYLGFFLQK